MAISQDNENCCEKDRIFLRCNTFGFGFSDKKIISNLKHLAGNKALKF